MKPFQVVCIDHNSGLETGCIYTVTDCTVKDGDCDKYTINGVLYDADCFRLLEI